jgi:hypothetical protein
MKLFIIIIVSFVLLAPDLAVGQSLTLEWSVAGVGGDTSTAEGFTLQSSVGEEITDTMSAAGFSLAGGFLPGAATLGGTATYAAIEADSSWNMISVPLLVNDYTKSVLYPTSTSDAFAFQNGYLQKETLTVGVGYWMKFLNIQEVPFNGAAFVQETVDVYDRWNILGCVTYPVPRINIIPIGTTIASTCFGFANSTGYIVVDTLQPGRAYWIKVNGAGKLVLQTESYSLSANTPAMLSVSEAKKPEHSVTTVASLEDVQNIVFFDARNQKRTLNYTIQPLVDALTMSDLPPPPPEGIFDVRYSTQQNMAVAEKGKSKEIPIQISSAEYPLVIQWRDGEARLVVDGKEFQMIGRDSVIITNPESKIKLKMLPSSEVNIPTEYTLYQNYPNPFNPRTVIAFDLLKKSFVTLIVYNILGQEVTTLLSNDLLDVGRQQFEFDASRLSSGVYFYKIVAYMVTDNGKASINETFVSVKKMLLLK